MKKIEFENIPLRERSNRTLEGTAFWASLHTPNRSAVVKFKGEPFFGLSLALDEKNAALAREYGLTLKEPDDVIDQPYIRLRRKRTQKQIREGVDIMDVKPPVVDTLQNEIPSSILIGNGSKVICKFSTYWSDTTNAPATSLTKTQVVDLKRYVPVEKGMVTDGSGFTVGSLQETDSFDALADLLEEIPEAAPVKTKKVASGAASLFDE